ncbi:predicted protein [Nematostella vectensis]|uniref:Uncharacterized protein n=1 Tax=Nematostella vectensis TaxID=45351 RepID=A7RJ29_NEMVE|nr:predicted protein [Nematostella vectensis]|eukprot:XP_001640673.1 predicted protein [Nematostella vectensis]
MEISLSTTQASNLVKGNLKVHKEKLKKNACIDQERAKFERKLNHEKRLLKEKLLQAQRAGTPRPPDREQRLKLPPILVEGSPAGSPCASPRLGRKSPSIADLATNSPSARRRAQSLRPESPKMARRGSMNEADLRADSPVSSAFLNSPMSNRRGTVPAVLPSQFSSSLMPRNLAMRDQARRESKAFVNEDEDGMKSLNEQFKDLESCRYLRKADGVDTNNEDRANEKGNKTP